MYPFVIKSHGLHTKSLSFYSNLIDHCLSLKSLIFSKSTHAQLIKVGFNRHTFLGNRCIDLYSKVGTFSDALQAFDDIANKNTISWNICLRVYVDSGNLEGARNVFEKLPKRDVVSWNSVISGYASNGFFDSALELFRGMQNEGKLKEAMDIVEAMPREPSPVIWASILQGIGADGDLNFTERVAERLIEYDPHSSLPYLVLDRAYEMRGKWESMVRVRKALKESSEKKVIGCSRIGIRNHTFVFKENHIPRYEGKDIYSLLTLLSSEMAIEGSVYDHCESEL
ncbi:hypothetical protein RHMOL_Rhmol11G0135600 [Rhododendron molle]|uniref:Uncharacterized protein n=1 Tax=Rhododendron molle TaxID=49168 RepID=A0ACC0LSR8_RHOML|nr:hypothetical protein RHMOL_Rhmol11G0135600 [Rhododendron molle]